MSRKQKVRDITPKPGKEVFVSRVKFPVSLTKASQGDSLAVFLASIQEILYSYETAKHFKILRSKKRKTPPIILAYIGGV